MTQQQTIQSDATPTESFSAWIQANTRVVGIGIAIIVVGGAGYWFYLRSAELKRTNAERALNQAKQSLAAGNAALAESDLLKAATRYKGTPGGARAAMLLAQLEFEAGKIPDGLKALEPYQTGSAAGPNLPAIWGMIGDGQMAQGKAADAAASYEKAADATAYPGEKAMYLAKAARAYMAGGNDARAKTLWEKLATDPAALPVRNEAEVRLGELTVRPAGKS